MEKCTMELATRSQNVSYGIHTRYLKYDKIDMNLRDRHHWSLVRP
jgi:hypothetical protein